MKIITANHISKISLNDFFKHAFYYLEQDLKRWQDFKRSARHAVHFKHGVFELMPIADNQY